VHLMRSRHQGVIAGAQTVRSDNPKLNVRLPDFKRPQPRRIIFTKSGNLPEAAQLFTDELKERTLIYTHSQLKINFPAANIMKVSSLSEALNDLFQRKLISLFLEGGPALATAFLKEGHINRVSLFMNPSFLGSGKSALLDLGLEQLNNRPHLKEVESCWLGDDLLISGKLK